jgi:hypothetical protein
LIFLGIGNGCRAEVFKIGKKKAIRNNGFALLMME